VADPGERGQSGVDPEDEVAVTVLEELRRGAGKYEELIEMLLEKSENAATSAERSRP